MVKYVTMCIYYNEYNSWCLMLCSSTSHQWKLKQTKQSKAYITICIYTNRVTLMLLHKCMVTSCSTLTVQLKIFKVIYTLKIFNLENIRLAVQYFMKILSKKQLNSPFHKKFNPQKFQAIWYGYTLHPAVRYILYKILRAHQLWPLVQ